MPNHVRNILTFNDITKKQKEFILERFTSWNEHDKIIDFDKVIPEPRLESECPEDCKVNKDSHIMEDKDRPWFDWYKWHNLYWGTKWNAYDGWVDENEDDLICAFNTAWSAPMPIYEQLAELYPNFEWTVKFADECGGDNCGYIIHDKGETFLYESDDMTNNEIYNEVWGDSEEYEEGDD